jgi:hypothetical protein
LEEFIMRKPIFKLLIIAAAAAVVSACASGPKIRVDKDPAANMSAYKTFGFFDHLQTDRPGYSSLMTTRLKLATTQQLERLGYTYDERSPQLRVNFFLKVADKIDIRSTANPGRVGRYVAWAGYPGTLETVDYKAGTLSIDLVDADTNSLVWQGLAEGKVSEQAMKNPGSAVDAVVASIFGNFPNQPAK